ncbi:uncharacterized protein [Euphorbia lathyris]|uniref:uncharacterized protein n=1 Tax=Euphorbia lathyris TaxID=212925 RepID=UPI003313525B
MNEGDKNMDTSSTHNRIRMMLSNEKRQAVYEMLLQKSVDGKLMRHITMMVASSFGIPKRTVQRIWKQAKDCGTNVDVSYRKTKNCGRKRIQIDLDRIQSVPLHKRTTLRSLSSAINISPSILARRLKFGKIRRHSNAIKPILKEENKRSRLQFCLSMLEANTIPHEPIFKGMYNMVHIDEKWFYMTKKSENYYLLPYEEDPLRTCKSKNFIGKVMFLVALARPRFDTERNVIFSRKIGVFPFVDQVHAKRSSVNRAAGTMETKLMTSINRQVIKSFLLEKVLPAIKEKWPKEDLNYPIFIQQDNAKTHISNDDVNFRRSATEGGFDIRLIEQPANSLNLNVLDLGFFAAVQSLKDKEAPNTIDELISAVVKLFEAFPCTKSDYIFLTLQLCMVEIMEEKGSQRYKIPHINKLMLERRGELPSQIKCDVALIQEVIQYLQ